MPHIWLVKVLENTFLVLQLVLFSVAYLLSTKYYSSGNFSVFEILELLILDS